VISVPEDLNAESPPSWTAQAAGSCSIRKCLRSNHSSFVFMQCVPISRTAEARFGKILTRRVLRRTSSNHLSSILVERMRFLCSTGRA